MTAALAAVLAATLLAGCHAAPKEAPGAWKKLELAILEDYDKGEDLRDVARDFALFRELGIHTWRGSIGWDDYEPSRGRYDFAWLHRLAALADSSDIRLRPYLGYTPEWASSGRRADGSVWNDPPARLEDWRQFVSALAGAMRSHRSIVSYEIYNEENARQWWDGSVAEYDSVLRAASSAIRAADPRAQVVLGGMVWPDPDWLENACAAGAESFDAVPFHAYPETWTPDSIRVENYLGGAYRDLLAAVDSCGGKPVWINETGFATMPGKSEADQANWWVRALATFAAAPRVSLIGVYEIKDLRPDRPAIGGAPNYHLGLTRADRTPKLAFRTVSYLAHFFAADSIRVEDPGIVVRAAGERARLRTHLFRRPDGRRLLVAWTYGDAAAADLHVPGGFTRARWVTLKGEEKPMAETRDGWLRHVALRRDRPVMVVLDP